MEEKKLAPKRRFSAYKNEWYKQKFGQLVFRLSNSGRDRSLPQVEFEDIISGEGRLNKDIRQKRIDKNGILFSENDILFGKLRPYLKNWLLADFEGLAIGDFWVFRPIDSDSRFIYLLIQTKKYSSIANLSIGTKMPRSDWNLVSNASYAVPIYQEQQKIGEFFKVLDERIANQERKIAKIKALKSAYLTEMFPQEDQVVPKRRFKEFSEDWKYILLKEAINSEFKGKAKAEMRGGKSPYLDTNYLNGGEVTYVNSPKDVEKDDVLVLWDGSQAGMVYHGFAGALGSTLKAYKPKYSGEFLYQFLKKNQKIIFEQYRTPNIPHVINTFVDEFWICMPCIEEQQKIGQFFKNLDNQITTEETKLEKLKQMKEAYLEEMFV